MIVWGPVNTGGRYNPITDNWTATTTTNAPAGRWRHTAVWTGTQMIVRGGCRTFGLPLPPNFPVNKAVVSEGREP
jgi:hypothetical protein